ncbi:Rho1 GTP-binding protein [Pilobolus umbonatus]|nr:Rho1 GTP-binding protein [Pilobolus umbonatus]
MASSHIRRNFIIVGDDTCGKTSLLFAYNKGTFPETPIPTVLDPYVAEVRRYNDSYALKLWDTSDKEKYARLRVASYADTDAVFICYAIDSPESLESAVNKWIIEVCNFCQNKLVLLVGCKKDIRDNVYVDMNLGINTQPVISKEEGQLAANIVGAYQHFECSALTGEGVQEMFECAAEISKRYGYICRLRRDTCTLL